jgi:transcriptional regulatory protein LEU3
MNVAKLVISIMVDRLYPGGHLRYGMEAHFLYVAFAAAFLINFLRPRFLPLIPECQQREIIATVDKLITVLSSNDVAIDCRHTPAIYAKFLSHQLDRYRPAEPSLAALSPSDDIKIIPQYQQNREQTPPHAQYSWPDCVPGTRCSPGGSTPGSDQYSDLVYQRHGEADMDFSIPHFMSTVTTGGPTYGNFGANPGPSYSALSGWDYQGPSNVNGGASFLPNAYQNQENWYNTHY